MPKNGIDVSEFQTINDFKKLREDFDFIMIRAGFGFCTIDSQFFHNINGCRENNIPYGCYWFSYACTVDDAKKEAEFFCDLLDKYCKVSLPVYIDWEYDSNRYAKQHGFTITGESLRKIVIAFLNVCNDRGYDAGIYTNPDFISRYFYSAEWCRNIGSLWLASWDISEPVTCDIWQYTVMKNANLQYPYISCKDLDMDKAYIKIPDTVPEPDRIEVCLDDVLTEYDDICHGILEGKYGSGSERKEKLGKYYDVAQSIINQAYLRKEGEF